MNASLLAKSRLPKGFTLIEILTVITIIAILATMGFTGYRVAQKKGMKSSTITRMRAIEANLTSYFTDNGEYPEPANDNDTSSINGSTYNIGGAKMLYQAMSGDGNDAIKGGDEGSTGEIGSVNKVYWDDVIAPNQLEIQEKKRRPLVEVADGKSYYLIDAFRNPFQYQVAIKDRNRQVTNLEDMYSGSDYELWSYGTLDKPLDDEKGREEWIKSWDLK